MPKSDIERVHLYYTKKDKKRDHPNIQVRKQLFHWPGTGLWQFLFRSVNVDHMIIGTIGKRGSAKVGSCLVNKVL